MGSGEELREAARLMRERAQAATPGLVLGVLEDHEFIRPEQDGMVPWRCSCGETYSSGWTAHRVHKAHQAAAVAAAMQERRDGVGEGAPLGFDIETLQGDHYPHEAFPDADRPGVTHIVCTCGLPWIETEGCAYIKGVHATVRAVLAPRTPTLADEGLAGKVSAVLDDYAPKARSQRGCTDGCGCTDCEMVEDLRALLADDAPKEGQ